MTVAYPGRYTIGAKEETVVVMDDHVTTSATVSMNNTSADTRASLKGSIQRDDVQPP